MNPSSHLIEVFPAELIEMISAFNDRMYVIHSEGLHVKNEKYDNELMKKYNDLILDVYNKERRKVNLYINNIETLYSEDDMIEIENMVSYFENKQNGFDRYNDQCAFQLAKQNNALYDQALNWLKVTNDYNYLVNIVAKYRAREKL